MQLQLTPNELQLAVDVLEQRSRELMRQIAESQPGDRKQALENRLRPLDELENRLIERRLDLSADELDTLAAELGQCDREFLTQLAPTKSNDSEHLLERERSLQRARDKILEACAMA